MLIFTLRRLNLLFITLMILTLIGYSILRLDGTNLWHDQDFFPGWMNYLAHLFQGDLGINNNGQPILSEIITVFPATLELCFFAFSFAIILGIALGTVAGIQRGKPTDTIISSLSLVGYSIPLYWLAILLIMLLSIKVNWLPVSGRVSALYQIEHVTGFALIDVMLSDKPYQQQALIDTIHHLILPTIVLAISPMTEVLRLTRSSVTEVMSQNFIKVAHTKGLSLLEIIFRHVLRNAIPPIIPKLGLLFSTMMTLAILTESIFNWPGIGRWILNAIAAQNYVAIQAGVITIGGFILLVNILADFTGALVNPLVRKEWNAIK